MAKVEKNRNFTTAPQIDWLTLRISYISQVLTLSPNYGFKVMPYITRVFGRVIEITDLKLNEVVATIVDRPMSKAIRQDLILIKFHNKLLYTDDLKGYVTSFCKDNGMKVEAISRLDIAVDFTEFANRLHPDVFITRFLKGGYVKKGQGKGSIAGKALQRYDEDFEPFKANFSYGKLIKLEYLRFGSGNNGLKYYLYNKTKELNDVKEKPYIRDRWYFYNGKQEVERDVWRLEFSITSNDLRFIEDETGLPQTKGRKEIVEDDFKIDRDTGEASKVKQYNVKSIDCLDPVTLQKIWASLVNKYMVFYINRNLRKDRNSKVLLFKGLQPYVSYTIQPMQRDATNTDKNFIMNLRRTYEDLRNKDVFADQYRKDIQNLIAYQIHKRGLERWSKERQIKNYDPGNPYDYKSDTVEIRQQPRGDKSEKARRFNKDD